MKNIIYTENKRIQELLGKLEGLKIASKAINISSKLSEDILRESLLQSAIYSARIEGNPLTPEEINQHEFERKPESFHKKEVFNLLSAYRYLRTKNSPKKFSVILILKLHQLTMNGISEKPGKFRKEPSAIFNQAGIAIYLAPSHLLITDLINELILFVRESPLPVLVIAAIAQFSFEKIHPFIDGNGRVGRLISSFILSKNDFFYFCAPLEEYIDKNKDGYYRTLEPAKNSTEFVEYFLEALVETAKKGLEKQSLKRNESPRDTLLPRRREILETIEDHPGCSFDFIQRRFSSVNPKTLHYDMGQLLKKSFILKIGGTRGALYEAK